MGLDIRLPIGAMFLSLGGILAVFGLLQDIALDLQCGAAMLLFGAAMTIFARRAASGGR